MSHRLIITALMTGTIATAAAQVNSSDASGYYARGVAMYADGNPTGAVDQLTRYFRLSPSADSEESIMAGLVLAEATLDVGRIAQAREMARRWLARYPFAADRARMECVLAECSFVEADYPEALRIYESVDATMLTGRHLAEYYFRKGFCLMKLGEYPAADASFLSIPAYASAQLRNAGLFYRAYLAFTDDDYQTALRMFEQVDGSMEPGNARDFYLSQIYFLQGDYDKALGYARKASEMDLPADLRDENLRVIGESLYLTDNPEEAIGYLRRYVDSSSSPALSALYILGLSLYDEGDYDAAVRALQPVTSGDDAMGQSAYLYIGQSQLKNGDTDAAILAFDKALRMNHDLQVQEAAYYNYAVARVDGAQLPFGSSVSTFEEFLRRYPRSSYAPKVQEYVVTGYITDNNYEKALESINRVANPSASILKAKQRVLYTLGLRDLSAGRVGVARQRLEEALSLARYDEAVAAETLLLLGDCAYREGSYAEAADYYRRYLATAPEDAVNRSLAGYDLGYALFAQKEFDKAIEQFNQAASSWSTLSPTMKADALNRIGDAKYYRSDFSGALADYRKAYDTNPATGDYALFQTAIMEGYNRDYKAKEATLDRMIADFPSSALIPSALLEKGENSLQLGRTDDAVASYRRLVKAYPGTEQGRNGYLQLAMTLQNTGDSNAANEAYREIIRRYPTSDEAKLASIALKKEYAGAGRIEELAAFLQGISGAPSLDPSEVENIAFESAEEVYVEKRDPSRLRTYVEQYPSGANRPRALGYLAEEASERGDDAEALRYAEEIITSYPDNSAVENALSIKAEIEYGRGRGEVALEAYRELVGKASTPQNLAKARLGVMRVSRELSDWDEVIAQAEAITATSVLGEAEKSEAVFSRGLAYKERGDKEKAASAWQSISGDTGDEYGARSAVYLGQLYLDEGNLKKAKNVADTFVKAQTPHQYWLARGFILLSDVNRAMGNTFEADEYLNALRDNYPGKEKDIFDMIDQRLK